MIKSKLYIHTNIDTYIKIEKLSDSCIMSIGSSEDGTTKPRKSERIVYIFIVFIKNELFDSWRSREKSLEFRDKRSNSPKPL